MAYSLLCFWIAVITLCSAAQGAPSKKQCSDANLAIDGGHYVLSKNYNEGSVLAYRCPHGYFPYPDKSRRCLGNGMWKPSPRKKPRMECRLVTCPDPLVLDNGSVFPNQERYYLNNKTTYECFSEYTLRGSSSRVCQANGKWSGGTPICSRDTDYCHDPGTPPGARRSGHIFNIDDKVKYRCEGKLTLVGSKERTCQQNGEWSGSEPECYYDYTYDTPEDVAERFGSSLKNNLREEEEESQSQHEKKIRLDKSGNLNIYIALDASDSIDEEHFTKSKEVIKKLIDKISDYEVSPKYQIFFFATKVTEIVNIADFYREKGPTLDEIKDKLDVFEFEAKGNDAGTNIAQAFKTILQSISFVKTQGEKQFLNVSHVILMFTDGGANMGGSPKPKVEQIKDLIYQGDRENREKFLDIYVFGLGDDVWKEEIDEYVTHRDGEKHFFIMQDMQELSKTFDEMLDESNSVGLCGLHKDFDDGRQSTIVRRQPWLAKIVVTHKESAPSNCMGSLVTPRFILTAAHCFKFGDVAEGMMVDLGRYREKVKRYIPHPKYNTTSKVHEGIPEFYDYDVALIELVRDVHVSVDTRPICIPCTTQTSGALKLSGSAVTCKQHEQILLKNQYERATFMSPRREPKHVHLKLGAARESCIEDAKKAKNVTVKNARDIVTDNFLCSGGIEPETDYVACKGESGGAVFVERNSRSVQVGILSWGVKNLCTDSNNNKVLSDESSRDFHINLFKVQPFLKKYLGDGTKDYAPLTFLD
ncbi:complement factor B isoform X2 [Denticeps clupeoides]|uniref:C3/C5 convertase n=1 Tax=Denticeps clupeoides TaxID=299321 RepID=A0AAY3ZZ57_9TELE|nr:complement factor B isoform X2 [Denticeps clupeoides]